jgi:hypothetical protein
MNEMERYGRGRTMADFRIERELNRKIPGGIIIRFGGMLTEANSCYQAIASEVKSGTSKIIVDLQELTFLGWRSIDRIVEAHQEYRRRTDAHHGDNFVVVLDNGKLEKMYLRYLEAHKIVVVKTCEEAIAYATETTSNLRAKALNFLTKEQMKLHTARNVALHTGEKEEEIEQELYWLSKKHPFIHRLPYPKGPLYRYVPPNPG